MKEKKNELFCRFVFSLSGSLSLSLSLSALASPFVPLSFSIISDALQREENRENRSARCFLYVLFFFFLSTFFQKLLPVLLPLLLSSSSSFSLAFSLSLRWSLFLGASASSLANSRRSLSAIAAQVASRTLSSGEEHPGFKSETSTSRPTTTTTLASLKKKRGTLAPRGITSAIPEW